MADNTQELIYAAIRAAEDKKARDLVVLDLTDISPVCDYFLICSGNSSTQVQAIAENIKDKLREKDADFLRIEGMKDAHWILMDYGTFVVHIFQEEDRDFYNLEHLWADAKVVDF
ncbi:iojap family protein [Thermincola ferriacetica]|uniref:Ribosomal silencing factor RsfS n=1 Tax=Thermincola ferriacetica TaxID=281456 RepID=A0A0L6W243_9FIRM|nr:ribosome silencing factor [Thermincola ferriacetica]KNZ69531.1 iojap family protein [Thermincola ferriacetica]